MASKSRQSFMRMISRDACAPVKCAGGAAILTTEWLGGDPVSSKSLYPWPESQRVAAETLGLQAAQESPEVLLLSRRELVKIIDDRVRLRGCEVRVPRALVRLDRLDEVLGSPAVQEK